MASDTLYPQVARAPVMDRSWAVVAASTIGLVFSQGTLLLYTFGVFVGPLSAEFHWSRTQIAGALAVGQYSLALVLPFLGVLIDRVGPRAVLLPSVVCLSMLIASLSLLTDHLWHYYLVFAAVSFTAGCASPLGYCAVLVRKFNRHLGLALGLALMGVGIGAATLPPLAQALTAALGWREAYATLGILTLLFTVPAALVATSNLPRLAPALPGAVRVPVMPHVKTRAFVLMCVIFLLLGVVSVGALANLVPIMVSRGFTPQVAAQIAGVTGLVTILGRGGIGWVLDRFYAPRVVCCVALIAFCAFLLLAYGEGAPAAYITAGLLGAVVGAEVDFTAFFVRRYFGPVVFGRLYGLVFAIFIVGTGSGPVLASLVHDRFGSYQPIALLFAGACLFIALLTFAMPRYPAPLSHG